MKIIVIGTNHKLASVCFREHISFSPDSLPRALNELIKREGVHEAIILSTCNRIEIYAITDESKENIPLDFLATYHGVDSRLLSERAYCFEGLEAIKHLFLVTSSLDSMVVGETQISGQVKNAFEAALKADSSGEVLNKLFAKAASVQKRIRTETTIGEGTVSVSYAAVQLAKRVLGPIEDKKVLIVGAGEMAELAVQNIVARGASEVMVLNRTRERAVDLAKRFHGIPMGLEEKLHALSEADIVISSTGASNYVIKRNELNDLVKKRHNRPLLLIDIAVPRDIEPDVNCLENVCLFNIDDLQEVVKDNLMKRKGEAEKAERIIAEEVGKCHSWLQALQVNPTIKLLREKADKIRTAELYRFLKKHKNLSEDQKSAVDHLTKALVNKLLQQPTLTLKESVRKREDVHQYTDKLCELFALEK
jgi:glutamyl-tRNA reductase